MHSRLAVLALALFPASHAGPPVILGPSGRMFLTQHGRQTLLDIEQHTGPLLHIPLTHPSDYWQPLNGPGRATLLAESPNHFLIFTDEFDSNPGNPQGQCGATDSADDYGERYLHVVAIGPYPHETLGLLIDSCLMNVTSAPGSPQWTPNKAPRFEGGQQEGKLTVTTNADPATVIYYVNPDGSVTRPSVPKPAGQ